MRKVLMFSGLHTGPGHEKGFSSSGLHTGPEHENGFRVFWSAHRS
jgi:hypothetical protein